jgi:GNAT superfamily N-acetyltransferase
VPLPSVSEIEEAGLGAWPGIHTARDGQWVMRAANGYTNRANSVQSLDPNDDGDVAARLERIGQWYDERGLPVICRVTPLAGPALLDKLDKEWIAYGHSHVMAMDLEARSFVTDENAALVAVNSPEWLGAQHRLQGYDGATVQRLRQIVERFETPATGITLRDADATPLAAAYMVVVDGLVFPGNVVTDAAQRGKGYGRRLMQSGFAWAREAGARRAVVQVAADNPPAIALYTGLGYAHQYDYHYRRLGP